MATGYLRNSFEESRNIVQHAHLLEPRAGYQRFIRGLRAFKRRSRTMVASLLLIASVCFVQIFGVDRRFKWPGWVVHYPRYQVLAVDPLMSSDEPA